MNIIYRKKDTLHTTKTEIESLKRMSGYDLHSEEDEDIIDDDPYGALDEVDDETLNV